LHAERTDNATDNAIATFGAEEPAQALRTQALRAAGALGLLVTLLSVLLLAAGAASAPSAYVPASHGGFPGWLSGPLHGLGVGLGHGRYQALLIAMAVGYALVLLAVRELPPAAVYGTIAGCCAILLAGPVLFSQDAFGYLSYARLSALHGLDPYTHTSAAAPTDAVYPFLGWHGVSSPYGPLFTLASYALVPLGVASGVWALKALAAVTALGAVALTARAAGLLGRSPRAAAAFLGLNPVLLAFAVGGAHNDTLLVLLLAAALALSAAAVPRLRSAVAVLVLAAGVKLSAGLALPFLVLSPRSGRERRRLAAVALAGLALVALAGVLGFGSHALGFLGAVRGQQQLVAVHSVPAELARLVGLDGTPGWWRALFAAAFVVVLVAMLARTVRGACDWRAAAGWSTLALLLCTAWLLPWYAIWPLPLAAVSDDRRLRGATLAFCAYVLLTRLPLANPALSP